MVDYHIESLGYSGEDLTKQLAFNADDVERVYLERKPGLKIVVSNN